MTNRNGPMTVDDRVAELIGKAPPLTPEQIAGVARIIVRERARISRERVME